MGPQPTDRLDGGDEWVASLGRDRVEQVVVVVALDERPRHVAQATVGRYGEDRHVVLTVTDDEEEPPVGGCRELLRSADPGLAGDPGGWDIVELPGGRIRPRDGDGPPVAAVPAEQADSVGTPSAAIVALGDEEAAFGGEEIVDAR